MLLLSSLTYAPASGALVTRQRQERYLLFGWSNRHEYVHVRSCTYFQRRLKGILGRVLDPVEVVPDELHVACYFTQPLPLHKRYKRMITGSKCCQA